jgi:hypothetical protein
VPETSVNVQPAAAQPGAPVAPFKLAMLTVPDGIGGVITLQCVCLMSPDGDPYVPLTEATGREIASLLTQLVNLMADQTNTFRLGDKLDPEP